MTIRYGWALAIGVVLGYSLRDAKKAVGFALGAYQDIREIVHRAEWANLMADADLDEEDEGEE